MNRHFRVWDPIEEEMYLPPHDYVILSEGFVRRKVHRSDDRTGSYTVLQPTRHDVTPMHYTGLDDAEGTPIYEGDIVEHVYADEPAVVEWSNQRLQWEIAPVDIELSKVKRPIVEGSRYENPELLDD